MYATLCVAADGGSAGQPYEVVGVRLPDGSVKTMSDLYWDFTPKAASDAPIPEDWPDALMGISAPEKVFTGGYVDVQFAHFEFYLVSIRPMIVLLRPHQYADRFAERMNSGNGPTAFSFKYPPLQNSLVLNPQPPLSEELWWWSPDLKQRPTPLTADGRAATIRFNDEVLEVRPVGDQWVTQRRRQSP